MSSGGKKLAEKVVSGSIPWVGKHKADNTEREGENVMKTFLIIPNKVHSLICNSLLNLVTLISI